VITPLPRLAAAAVAELAALAATALLIVRTTLPIAAHLVFVTTGRQVAALTVAEEVKGVLAADVSPMARAEVRAFLVTPPTDMAPLILITQPGHGSEHRGEAHESGEEKATGQG
jgi:hypothetical protein